MSPGAVALGVAIALAAALFACGGEDGGRAERRAAAHPASDCGRRYLAPKQAAHRPAELARARRGVFEVSDRRTRITPPFEWTPKPRDSLRFRANLANWSFQDALFDGYRRSGDLGYLRLARDIGLDWLRSNRRSAPQGGSGTWSGKVAGDRAPLLAYLLRAGRCEDVLDPRQVRLLRDSLSEHVRILLGPQSAGDTNHALFVQLGLAAVARQIPGLHGADRIRRAARRRFRRILEGRLAEGIWLEHSTSYQFLAIRTVEGLLRLAGGRAPRLRHDLARMRAAAAWLTAPDGRQTLFGDSRMLEVPRGIRELTAERSGLRLFRRAGYAAVRDGGAHLLIGASFHNTTHKHADELSFELYDRGRRLVADTGMYHKDPGPIRDFVVSAPAHSTLTVDGEDFPIERRRAYGSGVLAAGSGDGWYAIEARNPLLGERRVHHQRVFLYRPGTALVIVDRVRAADRHAYDRHLQLGAGIRATPGRGPVAELSAPGFAGAIYDAPRRPPARPTLVRGDRDSLAGLTSPDYREWRPRSTLRLRDRGRGLTRALTLALDGERLHATAIRWRGSRARVSLVSSTGPRGLTVTRDRSRLRITAAPAR